MMKKKVCLRFLALLCGILFLVPNFLYADDSLRDKLLTDLGAKNRKKVIKAVKGLQELNDISALPALEALYQKKLRVNKEDGSLYILINEDQVQKILTEDVVGKDSLSLKTPRINNAVRRILTPAIATLKLQSPDSSIRLEAAKALSEKNNAAALVAVRAAFKKEKDQQVRSSLEMILALTGLKSANQQERVDAIKILGDSGNRNYIVLLQELLNKNEDGSFIETDEKIRKEVEDAIQSIKRALFLYELLGNAFRGFSLGSILLLAALGLAITFGLMKVINMAHGEMLMVGAYATYVTQNFFRGNLPGFVDFYLVAAIPVAFVVAGLVGMLMERTVIRFLYGRPLETLLATWGISLLLIQTVRLIFGAQNVEVANPSWLSGGVEILPELVLPYNRIAILFFVIFVVFIVWFLLQKTPLGLHVRAVTQNRPMAASLGISTNRTDLYTFGLGSGIAGLGGVALSQIGNVGPELGQAYIVDSFMVVVLGGVGKLAGTVYSALGIGIVNKYLEPFSGAVFGKILVLVFIILFIQKRPQGLFALKARALED